MARSMAFYCQKTRKFHQNRQAESLPINEWYGKMEDCFFGLISQEGNTFWPTSQREYSPPARGVAWHVVRGNMPSLRNCGYHTWSAAAIVITRIIIRRWCTSSLILWHLWYCLSHTIPSFESTLCTLSCCGSSRLYLNSSLLWRGSFAFQNGVCA